MIEGLLVVLFAALNRIRGGGLGGQYLPGRPLYWVAPIVIVLASYYIPLVYAALFGLTYLLWAMGPWGRWFDIGRMNPDHVTREETRFEQIIADFSDKIRSKYFPNSEKIYDFTAFTVRHWILGVGFIVFYVLTGNPYFLAIYASYAIIISLIYHTVWNFKTQLGGYVIYVAELITGAFWGALLIATKLLT